MEARIETLPFFPEIHSYPFCAPCDEAGVICEPASVVVVPPPTVCECPPASGFWSLDFIGIIMTITLCICMAVIVKAVWK